MIREKEIADANRLILDFPDAGIQVLNGRYGPYITDKARNAKIPKDRDPKSLTWRSARRCWRRRRCARSANGAARAQGANGKAGRRQRPQRKAAAQGRAAAKARRRAAPAARRAGGQGCSVSRKSAAAARGRSASQGCGGQEAHRRKRARGSSRAAKKSSAKKKAYERAPTLERPIRRRIGAVKRYLNDCRTASPRPSRRSSGAIPARSLDAPGGRRRREPRPHRRRGVRARRRLLLACVRRQDAAVRLERSARKSPARPFEAMGLSLVFHPRNPHAPTTHCNVRFLVGVARRGARRIWWFGGGFDLTPYYPYDEDVLHWHRTARDGLRAVRRGRLRQVQGVVRPLFLPAASQRDTRRRRPVLRRFQRGRLRAAASPCMRSVGDHFLPAYLPIFERRKDQAYGERERQFQLYRRGRYVEFNLVYDRGTLFGLQSRGRTESILMSLPPLARWDYDWQPEPGSPEARLYEDFLRPRDYLAELDGS